MSLQRWSISVLGGCMILQGACAAGSETLTPGPEPTADVTKGVVRGPVQPPPTLRAIAFGSTEDQIKESHPVFAAGAAVGCRTLHGFTCGYELEKAAGGMKSLFVVAPTTEIHSLTSPWGPGTSSGEEVTWLDLDTRIRATGRTFGEMTRVEFLPLLPLKDLIGERDAPLGFEKTPLMDLNRAGVETEHAGRLRTWKKGEIEESPDLSATMGDHLKVRSAKAPALTVALPGTELSPLPIYVRPRFTWKDKEVRSFELVIPYGDMPEAPSIIFSLLEKKYGPGIQGKHGKSDAMVYGEGPQVYAWDEPERGGFHLKVVDVSDGEAFKGWWKGICLGFAGHWKGRFSGRALQGTHYLDGRVYPSRGKCRARFTITFQHGPGSVTQVMAVTAAKDRIKMKGLSFKGSATYHRRGGSYALDTFYMSPDDAVDLLKGTIRDTRKAHGSIVLRRK